MSRISRCSQNENNNNNNNSNNRRDSSNLIYNINDISRFDYKDVKYVSKQLGIAANYLLDSAVRAPFEV